MSTTIDNRVTSMKFDNEQFEAGVSTSLSTIDKLKKGLNFEGIGKSFDSITNSARNVSLDGISSGVESVKLKFSALQIMAVTALTNITNQAVNAGKKLVSAFTIDPMKDGFKEYETQMGAIQTIMANTSSKGTTMKNVTDALEELNTYSDKTIYNFTEMAKNIGTFTAAGVGLKPAVAAIKGIANLAAVSGSTSEQASSAMYQLSQAMASGTVKLMDWNSVVNSGMGGEIFQNSLKETARVHGINIDAMINKAGSFRETLESGWLSTGILTETLSKFTGDLNAKQLKAMGYSAKQITGILKMGVVAYEAATKVKTLSQLMDTLKEAAGSGWAKTWQVLIGDFEEAKIMFTSVSNVLGGIIGASADARNKVLTGWKQMGGRTALIDAISIAFKNVFNVMKAIGGAFKEVFPPATSKQLFAFTNGLKRLMTALIPSKILLTNIHETFKGLFSVLSIGVKIFKFFASVAALIVQALFPITGGVLSVTGVIGSFLTAINDAIEYLHIFDIALAIIAVPIKIIGAVIRFTMGVIAKGIDIVRNALNPYVEKIKDFVRQSTFFADIIQKVTNVFAPYIARAKEFIRQSTFFSDAINKMKEVLSPYIQKAIQWVKTSTLIEDVMDKITYALGKAKDMLIPYIDKAILWIKTSTLIEDIIQKIVSVLTPYINKLKEFIKTSTFFADAADNIAAVFYAFIRISKQFIHTSTFFADGMALMKKGWVAAAHGVGPAITFLKDIFKDFGTFVKEIFTGKNVFAATLSGAKEAFVTAAAGPNVLKKALMGVWNFLVKIKDGIVKVVTTIKNVLTPIFEFIGKKISGLTGGDVGALAAGVGLLMFANMIRKGLNSINDIVESFTGVMDQVGKTLKAFTLKVKAQALLTIAIALGVLALSLIALSYIDIGALGKSLGVLTILLVELVIALKILDKGSSTMGIFQKKGKMQLVGLAIALLILVGAVKVLSTIDPTKVNQGIKALGVLMVFLGVFMKATDKMNLKQSAGGLIAFGIGLLVLVGALVILAKLKPETLKQGGIALAVLMASVAMFVQGTKGGDLKTSAGGLTAFAIGLMILTGALVILAKLKPETLKQGGLALAIMLSAIAIFILATKGGDFKASSAGMVAFAIGLMVLTGALVILGKLDPTKLTQGMLAIATLMASISAFVAMTNGGDLAKSSAGIIGFALGITILSYAIKMLSELPMKSLAQGVGALVLLIGAIGLFVGLTKGGDLLASSAGMIGFAVGLTILTAAVLVLSKINPDKIAQGVGALAILIATIGIFVKVTNGADLVASGAGLKIFAIGILVLAGALAILSALDANKLLMASGAMSAVIISFALFVQVTKGADLMTSAMALILFSVAVGTLAKSLEMLTMIKPDKLKASAIALISLLVTIGLFTNLTSGGDLIASAIGLTVFSVGIKTLTGSLTLLAKLDVNSLLAATGAITVLLLAIGLFTTLTTGPDLMASAIGLTIFSGAIVILTGAIAILGVLPFGVLAKGIGSLALILIAIGLTSVILAPLAPAILILSAALLLFGVACMSVAVAALVFATALTLLSTTGAAGANVLIEVVKKIIALIPEILLMLAQGIILFAQTIGEGAPTIALAFLAVLTAIISTITTATPLILDCIDRLLTAFLKFIVDAVPKMVTAGMDLVTGIINGIADKIQDLIDAAFNLIVKFINGLATAIDTHGESLTAACVKLVKAVAKAIKNAAFYIWDEGVAAVKKFISGFSSKDSASKTAGTNAAKKALEGAKSNKSSFDVAGSSAGQGFANGLSSMMEKVRSAGASIGARALAAAKKAIDSNSPSKEFAKLGVFSGEGFVVGLVNMGDKVAQSGTNMGKGAINAVSNAISGIADIVTGDIDASPVIRPVLDLSDIQNGSKQLYSMMDGIDGYAMSGSLDVARGAANNIQKNKNTSDETTNAKNIAAATPGSSFSNVFNIKGNNPKEIAEEVSNIIQKQMGRRESTWA